MKFMPGPAGGRAALLGLTLCASLSLVQAGCDDEKKKNATEPPPAGQVPDFSLMDVNSASPTAGEPVSPRDYLGKVSAWYFGYAT